ncbi:MAG: phospholipase A [Xanthomonadales bacterium]|nr:phospholipase A [Xanthomonadales bacterium]
MPARFKSIALPLALLVLSGAIHAQTVDTTPDPHACVSLQSDALRLACYDKILGHQTTPAKTKPEPRSMDQGRVRVFDMEQRASERTQHAEHAPVSLLDSRWELADNTKLGTFNVRGYKPVYLLPVFYTSDVNHSPYSPTHQLSTPLKQQPEHLEAKFQLSLKTKVWQGIFGDAGDLWLGYTQSSHWQVYSDQYSRPFRETNYEPEAMLVFNTHYNVFGWQGRLLGLGVNHQSNGRGGELSRSWNRIIARVGFERPGWTVMFRPWWRISENRADDDNPDISDYMGRADLRVVHEWDGQELSVLLRHSLRSGSRSHGAVQLDWAFPIKDHLRGHLQFFDGYGESMIDYNHRAMYFGLGVSLLEWY